MKKLYLLSLMLMSSISLFTSCVDVDYYDLYDDEEEFFSPRSKKGKDMDLPDFTNYPRMYEEGEKMGWHEAECVACCYSNIYGESDKAICRWEVIKAAYGEFNDTYYSAYFDAVENSNGIPDVAVTNLFGNSEVSPEEIVKYCNDNKVGSDYTNVESEQWIVWAKSSKGIGNHVSKIHSLKIGPHPVYANYGYYMITIRVEDYNGINDVYHIYMTRKWGKYKFDDQNKSIIKYIKAKG